MPHLPAGRGLARFNGGVAGIACSPLAVALRALSSESAGGLALTDYTELERGTRLPEAFEHVVLVDPPACAAHLAREQGLARAGESGSSGLPARRLG